MTIKTPGKNTKKFVHIGDILRNTLKAYRSPADLELTAIWDVWDTAVGDVIAANAQPSEFKGKQLIVNVSDSTWKHHFHFLKDDMVAKLNEALEKHLIEDITFKVGPL